MADIISIRAALADLYTTTEPFALTFIKKDGVRSHKDSVRLGGGLVEFKGQKSLEKKKNVRTRDGIHIKDNHRILLYDNFNHHPFYVRICLLTHYNGLRIRHRYAKPN